MRQMLASVSQWPMRAPLGERGLLLEGEIRDATVGGAGELWSIPPRICGR
jgi:hypothetical protein